MKQSRQLRRKRESKSIIIFDEAPKPAAHKPTTAIAKRERPCGLPETRELLTVVETAAYLHCSIDHVYRFVDEGELEAENFALKTNAKTETGRAGPRYLRIIKQSVLNLRNRRKLS